MTLDEIKMLEETKVKSFTDTYAMAASCEAVIVATPSQDLAYDYSVQQGEKALRDGSQG